MPAADANHRISSAYTWRTPRGAASTCQPRPRLMNGSHSPVREARDRGPNITCKKGWPVIQVLKAIEVPGNRRCPLRERGVRTHDQRLFARIETRGARGARHVHFFNGRHRALRGAVVAREFLLLEGSPQISRLLFRPFAYTWRTPRGAASTCQPRLRLMNARTAQCARRATEVQTSRVKRGGQ